MRSTSLGKVMRGSFARSILGFEADGGCHGPWMRGSGIMVRGIPFLKKVAGFGAAEPRNLDVGDVGSDEDVMGLSVKTLCSKGFFDGVVRASSGIALRAASSGVRIKPDEDEGSSCRPRRTTSRFLR